MTEADIAADKIITAGIRRERPGASILSEESDWGDDAKGEFWCIDPIDGTEAFIDPSMRGYAVQIAKLEHDGRVWRPVVGVVYEPNHGELFAAALGHDLILERNGASASLPTSRPMAARVITSSRAPDGLRRALFAKGYADGGKMRSVGVKVGALIKGDAEIYPSAPALSYWDLAAPQLILEAAGGTVTDVDGNAPSYTPEGRLLDEMKVAAPMLLTIGTNHAKVLSDLRACAQSLGYQ